jgi:hypothetical protein
MTLGGTAVAAEEAPSDSPRGAPTELVDGLRVSPFGDANVDAAMELLARSGIATFDRPTSQAPVVEVRGIPSPVTLLRDQVRAMALEAWAGGGILGEDLDPLVPIEPGLAPASFILAGYVADGGTEGADVARALMGEQDWVEAPMLTFPQLVLMLFTSDLARDRMAERQAVTPSRLAALAVASQVETAQAGACSAVSNFITGAILRVFKELRLGESGGGVIFKRIWNFVVGIAERALLAVVKRFETRVLEFIARIAWAVHLASTLVSAVRPWNVTVEAGPPTTYKGVNGTPGQPGQLRVRVNLGGLDQWPPDMVDCARQAGRPLPNLKPEGAPVTWQPLVQAPADLVRLERRQGALDAQGNAVLDYVTLVDIVPEPWELRVGRYRATVTVQRPQMVQLRRVAIDALLGELPDDLRPIIQAYFGPTLNDLASKLDRILESRASGHATVMYHVPVERPTPRPSARATPRPTPKPPAKPDDACSLVDGGTVSAIAGVPLSEHPPNPVYDELMNQCYWVLNAAGGDGGVLIWVIAEGALAEMRSLISGEGVEPVPGLGWPAAGGVSAGDGNVEASVFVDLGSWGLLVVINTSETQGGVNVSLEAAIALAREALN